MKKIIVLVLFIVLILSLLLFGNRITLKIFYISEANRLIKYYNNVINHNFDEDDKFAKRLTGYKSDRLDITYAINNYFDVLEKSVNSKINSQSMRFESYVYLGEYDKPIIHGLKDFCAEEISKILNDDDILLYKSGKLFEKIAKEIEQNDNIFHKSDNLKEEWYINNINDIVIELPYNVYMNFLCEKVNVKNEILKIISISLYNNKNNNLRCNFKYKQLNGEIKVEKDRIAYLYDDNTKISIPAIDELFIEDIQNAELTFGQHDYDAEVERIREEYPLEGPSTFTNAWEEEIQGITYEPSKVLTMEEMYRTLLEIFRESTDSEAKKQVEILEEKLEELADNN